MARAVGCTRGNGMTKHHWLLGSFILAGCATILPLQHPATLILTPQITPGRTTQTVITPYTQASINHLTLQMYQGETPVAGAIKDIPNADLNKAIVFSNLKANTTYRVKATAYATSDLVISDADQSYVDITLTNNDAPTINTLQVKLIDRPFNGQGTASAIAVTPGGYTYPTPENLDVPLMVTTLAGQWATGSVDGTGTAAQFNKPRGLLTYQGNVYVADTFNHRIRKVTPAGVVTTLAGNGETTWEMSGEGTNAHFNMPSALAVDSKGTLYVLDTKNWRICKLTLAGMMTYFVDTTSAFCEGLAIDSHDNLYFADAGNCKIMKVTPEGVTTTFVGNGNASDVDGTGTSASINQPSRLTVDSSDNLYVSGWASNLVRKITPAGVVTTIAGSTYEFAEGTGTAAAFRTPLGIAVGWDGNIYLSDCENLRIRKITPAGVVSTYAGSWVEDSVDGEVNNAAIFYPSALAADKNGNIFFGENGKIRRIH